jgi:hypothetical protein
MSFHAYMTFVPGAILTAAQMNAQVRDNGNIIKTSIADDGRLNGEIQRFDLDNGTVAVPSGGGAITLNLALRNTFYVTLTDNVTSITVSNWTASKAKQVTIRFFQSVGSKTVAFPSGWHWDGGAPLTVIPTINKSTIVVLYTDNGGTDIFAGAGWANA